MPLRSWQTALTSSRAGKTRIDEIESLLSDGRRAIVDAATAAFNEQMEICMKGAAAALSCFATESQQVPVEGLVYYVSGQSSNAERGESEQERAQFFHTCCCTPAC